ncbi:MAG: alpha/beta hydrolase [Planctomycetaceae bacterium]|jgi:pimeloyl-ACP methyl ester carboxylesterase|nr:alpha/beta hydrolase [Planctomycetaceae bacterium]
MGHYKIDNINLFISERGTGQLIVFVHGFPFDHTIWDRTCNVLQNDFRVIAPDLRGLGQSELPDGWNITPMEQFADDLHFLLPRLGIGEKRGEKIVICGLSMGGYIVMQYARKYRNELAGLVLCNTKTITDSPAVAENRRKQAAGLIDGTLELRSIADAMIPKLFAETTSKEKPEIIQELRAVIESNQPAGVAAAALGMAERLDTTELLGELEIPVLVICGSEDQFSPPSEMKPLAEKAKHGTFAEIPNTGHLPPLEQPELFANTLKKWIHSLPQ